MKFDARDGYIGFDIFDVKRCCEVRNVRWVDDETMRWCEVGAFGSDGPVHQEDRITVYLERKLILFNEVDDADFNSVESVVRRDLERKLAFFHA